MSASACSLSLKRRPRRRGRRLAPVVLSDALRAGLASSAPLLPVLVPAWGTWARWLLAHRELLFDWTFHLDQVAMVLALAAEGIASAPLDVRWNTPIHDLTRIPPDPPIPAVIHYHQEIDAQGRIRMTGFPSIDRQIERVNEAIGRLWQGAFPNATFWQWRYLTDPELGSGIGQPRSAPPR